jgi:SHS2 domain-containing protein
MSCSERPFEEVEHTADLGLHVRGETLEELFSHAAQGMFELMRPELGGEPQPVSRQVALDSFDLLSLLVDWLNELVYLCERDRAIYTTYDIARLEPTHLEATIGGSKICRVGKTVKAATFSELSIEPTVAGYEATITFDV